MYFKLSYFTTFLYVYFQYEPPLTLDDSGINAIQLVCEPLDKTDDRFYGTSDSHGGPWGEWQTTLMCTSPSPDFR